MPANKVKDAPLPDHERCTKQAKETGDRCNARRWHDTDYCYKHTPAPNRKRIKERVTGERVKADLHRYGIEPVEDGPEMTGQAQLSLELRRTVAWIRLCEAQIQRLANIEDFVFGTTAIESATSTEEGTGEKGDAIDKVATSRTHRAEARPNAWIERLDWNRQHMIRITKQWIDAGYEAARLELERAAIDMFFDSMNRAIAALGHDLDDPRVIEVISSAVTGVEANKELSA